jgi:hypothetical protein
MKERSIGVVTSSTDEGVGSSCAITSWARTREIVPVSNNSTNGNVVINNSAKILAGACASNKVTDLRSRLFLVISSHLY